MTNDAREGVPSPLDDLIAAAAQAAPHDFYALPKSERMKHHRKALRAIFIEEGLQGVNVYKRKYEEAASIRLKFDAKAYTPKPKGYDAYLVSLAEKWLTDDVAVARTNRSDIEKMNKALGTEYSPDKHFSEPLADFRIKKIRAVYLSHGAYLDAVRDNTMSKIRKAAKAHRGSTAGDKPFGKVGVVHGDTVLIGGHPFPLEMNGNKQCIRVTIDGKRRRFYLAELEWMADLLGSSGPDPFSNTNSIVDTTTTCSIGELAYSPDQGGNDQSGGGQISGSACVPLRSSALGERLARLREKQKVEQPQSTSYADDVDPLTR